MQPHLRPGDEAPEGSTGTGRHLPDVKGTGIRNGQTCSECEGTGRIIDGIGGG